MHAAIQLLMFWGLAFVSLCLAIVLLNLFDGVIGNDLYLHSLGKEAVLAGVASLVEGAGLWLVLSFIPGGARAMIFPALVVALIYKVAHFEDWGKGDVVLLLASHLEIGLLAASLYGGHFQTSDHYLGCVRCDSGCGGLLARSV